MGLFYRKKYRDGERSCKWGRTEEKTRKGRGNICGGGFGEVTRAEKKRDRKCLPLLEGLLKLVGA